MANISTDFSTWSATPASNQPDSLDTASIQADLQALQAALKIIFPNIGAALTPTHTELNYVDGVTSAIQTQLNAKAASGANSDITSLNGCSLTGLLNVNDGADIASATTVDLTAATGNTVRITGTTPITEFTMNAGQQMELVAVGALPLTYHATTMNINGGASYTCSANDRLRVFKDGSGVIQVNVTKQDGTSISNSGKSMVRLNTANGYGSTNTPIRRFTNTVTNQGTDITYADSATLGATFTINTNGVYAISYNDQFAGGGNMGVSLNCSTLTTNLSLIAVSEVVCAVATSAANFAGSCSATLYLASGSVIRAHTNAGITGTAVTLCQFTITRVS